MCTSKAHKHECPAFVLKIFWRIYDDINSGGWAFIHHSMLEINDDIDSEMVVTDENIFDVTDDFSDNRNDAKEQILTSELTDSILKILTGKDNNQKNPDLISRMIMLRHLIDHSVAKAAMELDYSISR